ncbi:nitroreductase family protein [Clostridium pasteurianum]|uniref:Nitroreductase n=1 Tax=Clostridium pasteurianum BC1 TaxID=86416 RepID=R4K683_CLOPA|nr:nitroreductase family protein [Clostridium pasteurianum]AGK98702.1 nitroreductase [Clostridium pasteurianum BC1]
MNLINVDKEKCIKCGICVKECPVQVLKIGENGPEDICPEKCIACGHCVAVCPREAMDNVKTPLVNQKSSKKFPKLSPEEAENFLRSRRSIRSYKETSVPREKLVELVNIAHFAPSGHNLQGVSYIIIDDRKILDKAVKITAEELKNDKVLSEKFDDFIKGYTKKGVDTILRGAPSLVLAIADADFPRGRENSIFSLEYMELYAPTLGLGSCWAGVFERIALKDNSPMLELFNIPKGKKITGAVMVGYPKYNYPRLVERSPLKVDFLP